MSLELILENKKDTYLLNVLEENTSELQVLKTKKYLNENLNLIGKILVEEGILDTLKNNAGKIGLGVAGAAGAAYAGTHPDQIEHAVHTGVGALHKGVEDVKNAYHNHFDTPKGGVDSYGKPLVTDTEGSNKLLDSHHYTTREQLQKDIDRGVFSGNNTEVKARLNSLPTGTTSGTQQDYKAPDIHNHDNLFKINDHNISKEPNLFKLQN